LQLTCCINIAADIIAVLQLT